MKEDNEELTARALESAKSLTPFCTTTISASAIPCYTVSVDTYFALLYQKFTGKNATTTTDIPAEPTKTPAFNLIQPWDKAPKPLDSTSGTQRM